MTNSFQRYAGINAKLAEIAAQHATPPRWYETWRWLGPDSTDEQRLAVFQAIRDAGALSADAGFHLVAWQVEQILMVAEEEELWEIHEQLDAIRRDHGLAEDEDWLAGEAPPEYQELNRQYEDACDDLYRRLLERHGEHVMAQLYLDDQDEFERRWEAGRRFFHPPQESSERDLPDWLALLVDTVATSMEFDGPSGPLGIQWGQDDDRWLVTVYPTPVELVGGVMGSRGEGNVVGICQELRRVHYHGPAEGHREAHCQIRAARTGGAGTIWRWCVVPDEASGFQFNNRSAKGLVMKLQLCAGLLVLGGLASSVVADDKPKAEAADSPLKRTDLKELQGTWEMAVETKTGWKGTVTATIILYPARSAAEDFGRIQYDCDLVHGTDKLRVENAPGGGIPFAGLRRGEKLLLVTTVRTGLIAKVPFAVDPKKELSAPFTVTDRKLTLDFSKSTKHFCFPLADVDLPWEKLPFTKRK